MTDDSKATPRPWRWITDYDGGMLVAGGENNKPLDIILWPHNAIETRHCAGWLGACGLSAEPFAEANAALIVTAVNAHDALVAERDRLRQALEEARLQLEYLHSRWPTGSAEGALARIREALGDG